MTHARAQLAYRNREKVICRDLENLMSRSTRGVIAQTGADRVKVIFTRPDGSSFSRWVSPTAIEVEG